MQAYRVKWEIDVEASSPREAANIARQYQQYPRAGYDCGHFTVIEGSGKRHEIELDK